MRVKVVVNKKTERSNTHKLLEESVKYWLVWLTTKERFAFLPIGENSDTFFFKQYWAPSEKVPWAESGCKKVYNMISNRLNYNTKVEQ